MSKCIRYLFLSLLTYGFLPTQGFGAEFTVIAYNSDLADINLGDGVCDTQVDSSTFCTLRAAIQEANLTPESDIIYVPGSVSNGGLVRPREMELADVDGPEDFGFTGDFDIYNPYFDEDDPSTHFTITIKGDGIDVSWIGYRAPDLSRYTGVGRVFDIRPNAILVLEDIHLRYGVAQYVTGSGGQMLNGEGGCIRNQRGTLIVRNVEVTKCLAAGLGGGIYSEQGTLIIEDSQIHTNRENNEEGVNLTSVGGGIATNGGDTYIKNTLIWNNPEQNNLFPTPTGPWPEHELDRFATESSVMGGGIHSFGNLTIENSAIVGNRAWQDGGGVYHGVGQLIITNTTITGNSAGRSGGGLFILRPFVGKRTEGQQIPTNIINSTIVENHAVGIDLSLQGVFDSETQFGGYEGFPDVIGGHDIAVDGDPITIVELLVANSIVNDCLTYEAKIISKGNNISSDDSCEFSSQSDYSNTEPLLNPIDYNDHPVLPSYEPMQASPALNNGSQWYCDIVITDQRGIVRPTSGCDIGSIERVPVTAANQLFVVQRESPLTQYLRTNFPDNSAFNFEILSHQYPEKAQVNLYEKTDVGFEGGKFTYTANHNASGKDSLTFRVTDPRSGQFSDGIISFVIESSQTGPTQDKVILEIVNNPGGASVSPITVVNQTEIAAELVDDQFDQPLGIMFFSVSNSASESLSTLEELNTLSLTLYFPIGTEIPLGAVLRKLDKFGRWRTLPYTGAANETFGQINLNWEGAPGITVPRVVLHLADNDIFDTDKRPGNINSPIAIGAPKDDTVLNNPRSEPQWPEYSQEDESSGSASISVFLLTMLLLIVIGRTRFLSHCVKH